MKPELNLHALARENSQLKNDLQTIATRINHDLRTHLSGITTTGELLREMLLEKEPSMVAIVDSLLGSTDDLAKLIKRVSFVAKATANPSPKKTVAMGTIVFTVVQNLERLTLQKQATVIEPGSWPEVPGVSSWLETIWWNLLRNALQHGGKSPQIELSWSEDAEKFCFRVIDHGPGVADQDVPKLFQPFDSLHGLDSARGLGLAIVQRLVKLQKGDCGYEPLPDGGANFFFTLPKNDRPTA